MTCRLLTITKMFLSICFLFLWIIPLFGQAKPVKPIKPYTKIAIRMADGAINKSEIMRSPLSQRLDLRGATTTFVERGLGDVYIAWENEALLITRRIAPGRFDVPREAARGGRPKPGLWPREKNLTIANVNTEGRT